METSPIFSLGTQPDGSGTEISDQLAYALANILDDEDKVAAFGSYAQPVPPLTELAQLDLDNPALRRAIDNVLDQEGVLSAFQSFAS